MGLWSTVKGWLNIGGVKVLLWKYTEPLSQSNPVIEGAVLLKSKSDKTVKSLVVKVIEEYTTTEGSGEDKKTHTKTTVLGNVEFTDADAGLGYPLELKAGENREQPFSLFVFMNDRLQNYGGVVGGIGKALAFASSEKLEYYIVAEASVKGAAFSTTDKQKLKIGK